VSPDTRRGSTYEDEGTLLLTYLDRPEGFEMQMIDPGVLTAVLLNTEQALRLRNELDRWLRINRRGWSA
jgi:hypothetical protein